MRRIWPIWIFFLMWTSTWGQAPTPQPAALPVGNVTIAAVKGAVTFKTAAGADIPANSGQSLAPGTVIETAKGSAVLNLQDGSQIQVKQNSRVVVQDPLQEKRFSVEMFVGKLLAKIKKKVGAAPAFRMGTPTAVITVRGTEFSVEVNKKGRTEVQVYEGVVEVRGLAPSSPAVLIRPGFSTDIDVNRAPDVPREFGPAIPQQRTDDFMRSRGDDSGRYGDDRERSGSTSEREDSEREH